MVTLPARGEPKGGGSLGNWGLFLNAVAEAVVPEWQGRNDRIQAVRDARKHLKTPRIPPEAARLTNLPPSHDTAVEDLLRHAQGLFAQKLPVPRRNPLDPTSTTDKEAAEDIGKWLTATYERMLVEVSPVFAQMTDAFPQDGQTVIKVILRQHRWHIRRGKEEAAEVFNVRVEANRRAYFPYFATHIDTKDFYPISYDEDGLAEACEITNRKKGPLYEQYGAELGEPVDLFGASSYSETVRFIEYWNRTHFVYLVDEKVVKIGTHRYPFLPYFTADFSTTSMKDNKFQTEGLADPLVAIQDDLESVKELIKTWGFWTSLPPLNLVKKDPDALPLKGDEQAEIRPLQIIQGIPEGYELEPVRFPDIGATLLRFYDILREEKDRLSLAPILMGKMDHPLSAPATSSQLDVAKSIFGTAENNFRGLFNRLAFFLLYCNDKILKDPVPVEYHDLSENEKHHEWIAIGHEQIRGYYRADHQVQPITRMEAAIKQQTAEAAYDRKLIDADAVRAALPPDLLDGSTPTQMGARVRREYFSQLPEVDQKITSEASLIVDMLLNPLNQGTPENVPAGDGGMVPQTLNQLPPDLGPPPGSIGPNLNPLAGGNPQLGMQPAPNGQPVMPIVPGVMPGG